MDERAKFITIEGAAPPSGGHVGTIKVDGTVLRTAYWLPGNGVEPKGTVLLFSGRTEFIEKYYEVIGELIDRQFAVATLDWRGQGLSARSQEDPLKGHVDDFAEFDADAQEFVNKIVVPNCPAPYFLLAHSMGGNIALRYLGVEGCVVSKAILVAPMTGVHTAPIPHWAARLTAAVGTLFGLRNRFVPGGASADPLEEKFEDNSVTSDPKRFDRYKALITKSPELALGAPTLGWLSAAFKTMKETGSNERLSRIRCPVLILSASADTIADSSTHDGISAGIEKGELYVVPDAKHEIMMEQDAIRAQFWGQLDRFFAS